MGGSCCGEGEVPGKAPGIKSEGVVGCSERGFVRSAGDCRGSGGDSGSGGGGGISVPAVRETFKGGKEGSWNLFFQLIGEEIEGVPFIAMVSRAALWSLSNVEDSDRDQVTMYYSKGVTSGTRVT